MLPTLLALLLGSGPTSASGAESAAEASCQERQRFELSFPTTQPFEVCISPGMLTGFLFDTPAVVEIQDEARFLHVSRSQQGISFVPPQDLAPGERLRLTVEFQSGHARQTTAFTLVAHATQAAHQIDVYRDRRDWQTLHDEARLAWLQNKRLQEQNASLLSELDDARAKLESLAGLRGAYLNNLLAGSGIHCGSSGGKLSEASKIEGHVRLVKSCRSSEGVSVELLLETTGDESWTITDTTLVDDLGGSRRSIRVWQESTERPNPRLKVFVEFNAQGRELHGLNTLIFHDMGTEVITLSQVSFP